MKTLVLLSALVLLAFLAQADPLPEATGDIENEEQTGVEDQAVSISFGDPEASALQDAASRKPLTCFCRSRSCEKRERISGVCSRDRKTYVFCCR